MLMLPLPFSRRIECGLSRLPKGRCGHVNCIFWDRLRGFSSQELIQNILAHRYNGWISDEGTGDETWRGDPTKYPTYDSFLDVMTGHVEDDDLKKRIKEGWMWFVPEEARNQNGEETS